MNCASRQAQHRGLPLKGAGLKSGILDADYGYSGAKISSDVATVAGVVLKPCGPAPCTGERGAFHQHGMNSGYAGIENVLFFRDSIMKRFANAKKRAEISSRRCERQR